MVGDYQQTFSQQEKEKEAQFFRISEIVNKCAQPAAKTKMGYYTILIPVWNEELQTAIFRWVTH